MNSEVRRRSVFAAIGVILLVGLAVRIYHLDHRTLTHPEFYVPGIELPDHVEHPNQRMTVREVLTEALNNDIHAPGYHVVMLGWNRTFGTGLFAMRMSSLLFGMLAILALFAFARRAEGVGVALLSAGLLALHGHHVFWSQNLRPWTLLTFLGPASCYLLFLVRERRGSWAAIAYALVTCIGLWADYFFWPVFAGQVAWVLIRDARSERFPAALSFQLMALVLAMPVFIYLRYHLGRPSHVPPNAWPHLVDLLQFGGVLNQTGVSSLSPFVAGAVSVVTAVAGGIALIAGFTAGRSEGSAQEDPRPRPLARGRIIPGFLACAFAMWLFVEVFFGDHNLVGHGQMFVAMLAAPLLIAGMWLLAARTWRYWSPVLRWIRSIPVLGGLAANPTFALPFIPFAALFLIGFDKPVLATYALLTLTPFYLVIFARGILRAGRLLPLAVVLLAALFAFTSYGAVTVRNSSHDYQGLAVQMMREVEDGDVVITLSHYWTAPLNYYLKPGRYRVVPPPGADGEAESGGMSLAELPDRVWVAVYGDGELLRERLRERAERIPGYRERSRLTAFNCAAVLFVRESPR